MVKTLLLLGAVMLVACGQLNPKYCAAHPDDRDCPPRDGDVTSVPCASDDDCMDPLPRCEPNDNVCVECLSSTDCSGGIEPACEAATHVCRACAGHAECASAVCRPDGSCAEEIDVAYVREMGSGTTCTKLMPCLTIEAGLATKRKYVKVSGAITDIVTIDNQTVTVFAEPGSTVTRGSPGVILDIKGNAGAPIVTFYDLEIVNLLGSTGEVAVNIHEDPEVTFVRVKVRDGTGGGISVEGTSRLKLIDSFVAINGGLGLEQTSSGAVEIRGSVISRNLLGGAKLAGNFSIVNSVIAENGTPTSTFGGLLLDSTASPIVQFNTIADNRAMVPGTGVLCASSIALSNSIVVGNDTTPVMCTVTYSLTDTGVGTNNKSGAPRFISNADPFSKTYYRIDGTSAAVDSADPSASLERDIDDEKRPKGMVRDIGADESQ